ncbi:hypothetical protein HMPREF0880_02792 [Yokenella regensburgei ATCC 43003]|nr:hypothetical protein HMPREF0880_02792 [Yokenella regensburgei ATCC 43003]
MNIASLLKLKKTANSGRSQTANGDYNAASRRRVKEGFACCSDSFC